MWQRKYEKIEVWGGKGSSVKVREQKKGAENNELCSLTIFSTPQWMPHHTICCNAFLCLTLLFSYSNSYFHTHSKDGGFVRHRTWAAVWKWLAFCSFSLNLHFSCADNVITRGINMFPGWHVQDICPAPQPGKQIQTSQEEHHINNLLCMFVCFFTYCFTAFPLKGSMENEQ